MSSPESHVEFDLESEGGRGEGYEDDSETMEEAQNKFSKTLMEISAMFVQQINIEIANSTREKVRLSCEIDELKLKLSREKGEKKDLKKKLAETTEKLRAVEDKLGKKKKPAADDEAEEEDEDGEEEEKAGGSSSGAAAAAKSGAAAAGGAAPEEPVDSDDVLAAFAEKTTFEDAKDMVVDSLDLLTSFFLSTNTLRGARRDLIHGTIFLLYHLKVTPGRLGEVKTALELFKDKFPKRILPRLDGVHKERLQLAVNKLGAKASLEWMTVA